MSGLLAETCCPRPPKAPSVSPVSSSMTPAKGSDLRPRPASGVSSSSCLGRAQAHAPIPTHPLPARGPSTPRSSSHTRLALAGSFWKEGSHVLAQGHQGVLEATCHR